jgi:luciferase-type oxidoreductase
MPPAALGGSVTTGHENAGYRRLFDGDDLTFGVGFPLTGAREETPDHEREVELAALAEDLGFDALWARDVPLYWPRFGDAGQTFDVWPWLGHVAAHTDEIALGTASVVLPLRHPLHVAKSAATVDRLSDGRLVLGVATGDRDPEYPAFDVNPDERGALFRESVALLRTAWRESFPEASGRWGELEGDLDLVPTPTTETLPLLPTGHARQDVDWLGEHGDGWLFYQLPRDTLESYLADWREASGGKPYAMAVRTELADDSTAGPEHVHQGFRAGSEWFVEYFRDLEAMGVDHVLVSAGGDDPAAALERFAQDVLDRV